MLLSYDFSREHKMNKKKRKDEKKEKREEKYTIAKS